MGERRQGLTDLFNIVNRRSLWKEKAWPRDEMKSTCCLDLRF